MRKEDRFMFENPNASTVVEFNMTTEAMMHRIFLLKKKKAAQAAKKDVK